MIRAMNMPSNNFCSCAVDAELFDSLEDAIAFVAERGGGKVYTELVGSLLAEIIAVPNNVELVPPRGMVMKKDLPPET
ncbi:MAG: hypothetical protein ACRBM6_31130 [Geminicoccales bacterium]